MAADRKIQARWRKDYRGIFGNRDLSNAGAQICKRLDLRRVIAASDDGENSGAAIDALNLLFKDPMGGWISGLQDVGGMKREEGTAVGYLRGFTIAKFADDFSEPETHSRTLNDRIAELGSSFFEEGKLYIVINATAPNHLIRQELEYLLLKAREERGIKAKSLPRLTSSNELLPMIERILAVHDWEVLSSQNFPVGSFSDLARGLYTEEESSEPEKALRSLVKGHKERVMSYEYAWALQEQGLKRQGS